MLLLQLARVTGCKTDFLCTLLNEQNSNFARAAHFIVHLLPSLHNYDVKMSNFTSYGGRKQAATKEFSFSF